MVLSNLNCFFHVQFIMYQWTYVSGNWHRSVERLAVTVRLFINLRRLFDNSVQFKARGETREK